MSELVRLREELDEDVQREFAARLAGVDASTPEGAAVLEDLAREAWDRVQLLALLRAVPADDPDLPIGCVTDALINALGDARANLAIWRAARCAARLPDLDPPLPASRIWALFGESLTLVGSGAFTVEAELERACAEAAEGDLAGGLERVSALAASAPDRYGFASLQSAQCALHLTALRAAMRPDDHEVDAGLGEVAQMAAELAPDQARAVVDALIHLALRAGRFAFALDTLERAQSAPRPASPFDRPVLVTPYFPPPASSADAIIEDVAGSMAYPPLSGATLMNLVRLELALQVAGQLADAGVVALAIDHMVDGLAAVNADSQVAYAAEVLERRGHGEEAGRLLDRFQRATSRGDIP
jgi:hypothetical protein